MQQEERGASVSTFSIVSWMSPPTGAFVGGIKSFQKKARQNHNATDRWNAFLRVLKCPCEGVKSKDHTSGWRIGTQPASFSYSSIASAILVVMYAEHCGKRLCKGETNRGGGGERSCQKTQMMDRLRHTQGHISEWHWKGIVGYSRTDVT